MTLELGGKSPAIVAPDLPIKTAAERILWAKMFNASQICTNVDYMFLPTEDAFRATCSKGLCSGLRSASSRAATAWQRRVPSALATMLASR